MNQSKGENKLKRWEIGLIIFSLLISLSSIYLYVSGIPVRYFLHSVFDAKEVGKINATSGIVRLLVSGDVVFKEAPKETPVHNLDFLVTNEKSTATVLFDDGTSFEMGPSSMVQISYESRFTLAGIVRGSKVTVVQGRVTAKSVEKKVTVATRTKTISIPSNSQQTVDAEKEIVAAAPPPTPSVTPTPSPTMTVAEVPSPTPSPSIEPTPTPSPTPTNQYLAEEMAVTKLRLVSPAEGAHLRVADGSRVGQKVVNFKWNISPPKTKVLLSVWKIEGDKRINVVKSIVEPNRGFASHNWTADHPGLYEWQLGEDVSPIPNRLKRRGRFIIDRDFKSIVPDDPLVGGKKIASSMLQDKVMKDFDIVFKWAKFPGVKKYKISVLGNEKSTKALLEREVEESEYHFNKGKVYQGKVFFKVSAELENGFVVESALKPFVFNFLPPILVIPDNKTIVAMGSIRGVGKGILITWQKTNFTENYEIEISEDMEFKISVLKKKLTENYLIFKPEKAGKFWWRVRSYAINIPSPVSDPFEFTVTP
jgi:hypothetical protein